MNYFAKDFKGKVGAAELLCPTWADFKKVLMGGLGMQGIREKSCFKAVYGLGTCLQLSQFVP